MVVHVDTARINLCWTCESTEQFLLTAIYPSTSTYGPKILGFSTSSTAWIRHRCRGAGWEKSKILLFTFRSFHPRALATKRSVLTYKAENPALESQQSDRRNRLAAMLQVRCKQPKASSEEFS
jgi:hypothetical protein